MGELPIRSPLTAPLVAIALLIAPMAGRASAQDRSGVAMEVTAGWVGFADDGIVGEGLIGGAARVYLRPRVSIGPEISYINGQNHSHLMLTGNVTFDLLPVGGASPRRVTPFVVAGAGVFQTRETFFGDTFTSSEGAFTAGGGVRALVGRQVTVGLDARVGWELHVRVNGLVGLRLGR
jgi:hypothetical protein